LNEKPEKKDKQKANWNIKPYLAIGLIAFLVVALSILVFFLIFRYHGLAENWGNLMDILQPIILGVAFAYLINPIVRWEEKHLLNGFGKYFKKQEKAKKTARALSVLGAIVFVLIIIAILLNMVIPEMFRSIEKAIMQVPGQVDDFIIFLEGYISTDSEIAKVVEMVLNKGVEFFETWVQTELLPQARDVISSLTSGVISVVKLMLNMVIGVIVSVYVLMSKETFTGQAKKLVYTLLPVDKGNAVVEIARKSHEIFGGFISGKILDSAIIGVLCFVVLYLLKMPYALLVSVIVGVTNVVPFFGPFIGAIPSAILIMLASPIHGVYFIIFVLILQQLDGNVIGPRILGESTGLSSFWVIFSILVSGGLFGFIGMVLGVPVFATIFYLIQRISAYVLRKKGLPEESTAYTDLERINPDTRQMDYTKKSLKSLRVDEKNVADMEKETDTKNNEENN